MKKENYLGYFTADTNEPLNSNFISVYFACGQGVYSIKPKESRRYAEVRIFPRKSEIPLDEKGNPISEERQEEIIKAAVDFAKRRTHCLVLTRFKSDGTLVERVA
jgi:hypothetical protein